jgi:hypothetical protein
LSRRLEVFFLASDKSKISLFDYLIFAFFGKDLPLFGFAFCRPEVGCLHGRPTKTGTTPREKGLRRAISVGPASSINPGKQF